MKKVLVASLNPTKINATRVALETFFPNEKFDVSGVPSKSGVPDQPMGNEQTFNGAQNRVNHIKKNFPNADYWVGIEGGLIEHPNDEMEAMAWIVAESQKIKGKARTAGFFIAPKTVELIKTGLELGTADEQIFGVENSKQKMGSSGLLTDNLITRERFYIDGIILALIPFKKPSLFKSPKTS